MFLHIGNNMVLPTNDIVGIFDIGTLQEKSTKEFLKIAKEEGFVEENEKELQKNRSFILTQQNVYFSPISSITLKKRVERFYARIYKNIYLDEYLEAEHMEPEDQYSDEE